MYCFIIYSTKFKVALGTLMRWRQYILVTGDREYLQTPLGNMLSFVHCILNTHLRAYSAFLSVYYYPSPTIPPSHSRHVFSLERKP